jgi:hypothetical protein
MANKKVYLSVLVFFCSLLPVLGTVAAPCYGTRMPEKGGIWGGWQFYSVIDRDLEGDYGSIRSNQHFFQLSYGLTKRVSLDFKIGMGNVKQHPPASDEVDYNTNFAGGYGFRVKLLEDDKRKIDVVFGFQHISVHPHRVYLSGEENKAILDDWQLSLLFSKDISELTPYLGVKFSRLDYIHWVEDQRKRRMSDLTESVGVVAGIDIPFLWQSWLNLEGHFIDEAALSVAVTMPF